jgi:hypothetical protein
VAWLILVEKPKLTEDFKNLNYLGNVEFIYVRFIFSEICDKQPPVCPQTYGSENDLQN